jgi:hypothetical protein
MEPDQAAVTAAYLEHLTDGDVARLGAATKEDAPPREWRASLRSRRGGIEDLLQRPELFEAVLGAPESGDPLIGVSPFLAFAVAVHRTAGDLASATYAAEWIGVGRRTPVFDVARLRGFLSRPWHRFFLAELLASYTHVSSGSVLVWTRRGPRRQRFSELDPVRLAGLLEVVSAEERPGVLRRLGDLALFLTGVFPDYVARRGFAPIERGRLVRAGRLAPPAARSQIGPSGLPRQSSDDNAVALLEQIGRRSYQAAFQLVTPPVPGNIAVLGELSSRFGDARRILGVVTERYLFAQRERWFGMGR